MIHRTGMSALPPAANSGQYLATGASGSSSPRSIRMCAHSDVIALVVDQALVGVPSCQGVARAGSAQPAHRFATTSPPATTAALAPISSRSAKFAANAALTGSKPGAQVPWIVISASLTASASRKPSCCRPALVAGPSLVCYACQSMIVNGWFTTVRLGSRSLARSGLVTSAVSLRRRTGEVEQDLG